MGQKKTSSFPSALSWESARSSLEGGILVSYFVPNFWRAFPLPSRHFFVLLRWQNGGKLQQMSTPFCEEDRPLNSLLWQIRVEGLFTMLPPEGFPVYHFARALALSASSPRFFADHLSHSDEPRVEERTNGSDSGPEKSGEYFSLFALDRNASAEQSLKYAKSNYCAKHPNVSRTKTRLAVREMKITPNSRVGNEETSP